MMQKLSAPVRAAVTTAIVSFVSIFGASSIGWLEDFIKAVSTTNAPYPSLSVLGSAAVAAGTSAFIGMVNFIFRQVQTSLNIGTPPVYTAPAPGTGTPATDDTYPYPTPDDDEYPGDPA